MHVFCAGEQEGTEEEAHTHKLEPALPALPWLFPVVQTFSSSGNVMDEKTNRLTGDGAEMCLSKQKTKKKKNTNLSLLFSSQDHFSLSLLTHKYTFEPGI